MANLSPNGAKELDSKFSPRWLNISSRYIRSKPMLPRIVAPRSREYASDAMPLRRGAWVSCFD